MELLKQYLISNKVTESKLHSETHDAENRLLPQRNLFVKLRQYANKFIDNGEQPRLIALAGLRGVGKTTLMWQTAKHIFENKTHEIYFINVDDLNRLGYRLYDAFNVLENNILQKPFHELQNSIVFLIDEVHEAENWDKDLKILYERCKKSFILCTGSSALLLHQSPDLASRLSLIRLYPFRFTEFIQSKSWMDKSMIQIFPQKGLESKLKQILFYSENIDILKQGLEHNKTSIHQYFQKINDSYHNTSINELINEYISYHNIARFLYIKNKPLINDRIVALFERILFKDIPVFTKIEQPDIELMFRLLLRLALSEEINTEKLASSIGCRQQKVENFIETLHKAEILNVLNPYGSTKIKTGHYKKPFFMSPSLRRALYQRVYGENVEEKLRAKLLEDIVAMYLRRLVQEQGLLSFGVSDNSVSPDFIIETLESPIVLEVGMKKTSTKQIAKYQVQKRYGIIINATSNECSIKNNTLNIPLSWFLLL